MRVLRIDLEYDGTDFRGFAPQPGARTVGGELDAVLSRVLGEVIRVTSGARTVRGAITTPVSMVAARPASANILAIRRMIHECQAICAAAATSRSVAPGTSDSPAGSG